MKISHEIINIVLDFENDAQIWPKVDLSNGSCSLSLRFPIAIAGMNDHQYATLINIPDRVMHDLIDQWFRLVRPVSPAKTEADQTN